MDKYQQESAEFQDQTIRRAVNSSSYHWYL